MSAPVRTQIGQALAELVVAGEMEDAAGNVPRVELNRDSPVSAFPSIVIMLGGERHAETSYPELDVTMSVSIEGHVQVTPGPENDEDQLGRMLAEAIDLLFAQVYGLVMAEPRQLGGLAHDMTSSGMTPFTAGAAAVRTGGFEWTLDVQYTVARDTLFSQTIGD